MTKPDPAMYRLFLETYHLAAEDCAFVDDTPENVEAARGIGLMGIEFTSHKQLIARLLELGVRLPA